MGASYRVFRYASLNGYGRLDGAAIYGGVNDIADAPVFCLIIN